MTASPPAPSKPAKPKKEDAADRIYAAIILAKATAIADNKPWSHEATVAALRSALITEGFIKVRVNGRDLHFDALAEACGFVGQVTKAAAGQIALTLKEIRDVDPGVTPEKIAYVAAKVMKQFEGKAGPRAVSVHWHRYSGSAVRTKAAKDDVYQEPDNWRDSLRALAERNHWDAWQVNEALAREWDDVSITLRQEILKAMQ